MFNPFTDLIPTPANNPVLHTNVGKPATDPATIAEIAKYNTNPNQYAKNAANHAYWNSIKNDTKNMLQSPLNMVVWLKKYWWIATIFTFLILILVYFVISLVKAYANKIVR